jgi:peptide subunit release factor 1 (eRF1)
MQNLKRPRRGLGLGGVDYCTCPKCGYKEKHQKGLPCVQIKCPKCGTALLGEICYK